MRTRRGGWWTAGRCGVALLVAGCQGDVQRPEPRASSSASRPLAHDAALRPAVSGFDPLAYARAQGEALGNPEAHVPPQCYTRTGAQSNACWTCHTSPHDRNTLDDVDLQERYSFSRFARTNHWDNLFIDRRAAIDAIADDAVLAYVREDNYQALRGALAAAGDFPGYAPDVELRLGFDDEGFARDGSDWRAFRYKPFPGAFWPTNGSADDGAIRLPPAFRETDDGVASRAVYKINLAILEAAVSAPPGVATAALDRKVEPIDERVAQLDLDGDGAIRGVVTRLRGLPARYVGAAAAHPVRRGLYPEGVEFLHSVRYLDPESLTYAAVRMKELRYARKEVELDDAAIREVYAAEEEEEHDPAPPVYEGSPELGYRNDFGWRLQGYIEDVDGRLRLQSAEEHRFCMGCHSTVGVTVDQTFSFPRKVPGEGGWRPQALQGIPDVPQAGHTEPEILTYFRRVGGGDELRANDELLTRFFRGGVLDEEAVRRAAPGGAVDIQSILLPSRGRALALDKAYWLIVREQSFHLGRDPVIAPAENVHRAVESGETELKAAGVIYRDGRAQLDWSGV